MICSILFSLLAFLVMLKLVIGIALILRLACSSDRRDRPWHGSCEVLPTSLLPASIADGECTPEGGAGLAAAAEANIDGPSMWHR